MENNHPHVPRHIGAGIVVKDSRDCIGRGLFAERNFKVGDLLFIDEPFHFVRFHYNQLIHQKPLPFCCAYCMRFVGTLQNQINKLAKGTLPETIDLPSIAPVDCILTPQLLPCNLLSPTHPDSTSDSHSVCDEVYCSVECRDKANRSYHRLLCPNILKRQQVTVGEWSFLQFQKFVIEEDEEHYFLAFKIILNVVLGILDGNTSIFQTLLDSFCHKSYLTFLDQPDELPILQKSFQLIQNGFKELIQFGIIPATVPLDWLTFNNFSEILGMLRLNSHVISISSPVRDYILAIDSLPEPIRQTSISKLVPYLHTISQFYPKKAPNPPHTEQDNSNESEDEDEDDDDQDDPAIPLNWPNLPQGLTTGIFPGSIGSGLYPKIAMLNHSCEFNATIEFEETNKAMVLVTKDIGQGEEIYITYVPDGDLKERTDKLRDYGFTCVCTKCCTERASSSTMDDKT